uniref:Uncharacterized protein n=1 Tax=Biomphalaria glabrata TaxID=6526 RepID=A0A2C9LIX2_BIOGL
MRKGHCCAQIMGCTKSRSLVSNYQELEAIKARVREMEEEAEKLKEMQTEVDKQMNMSSPTATPAAAAFPTPEEKQEADNKSIFVGNVRHFLYCLNLCMNDVDLV